ncbi:MAG: SDR family NAD(P)-dependent oxidoreductase [Rhodobiaceae bacterium]|nr:SDR family NAD(P)-dependent oxidoreductase [Rhodobiaceae bacterium]MCC0054626.1 SDR family NAD(P)-dependent oxidoreductase [Rhodobiaceae bacterium]
MFSKNTDKTGAYAPIAIVGIGCRFPGGIVSPRGFWDFLVRGGDGISEVPPDRWNLDTYYDPEPGAYGKVYVRRGGFIDDIDQFDPQFFGISPREAGSMDPQQRLLLETTWEAFEDAGIRAGDFAGRQVGVYVGLFTHDYENLHMRQTEYGIIGPHTATGMSTTIAANRLSHAFGFNGPSMVIDTACSSSLVAVHLAARSLQAGECELAVASGVNVQIVPEMTMSLCSATMLAPDGYSKSFNAAANGYARADGVGVVLLKKLDDAIADGDPIYATILGSAVNQDGRSKGITVPTVAAQQSVIRAALAEANIAPEDVSYVEAHGTGTPVGDPVETRALGETLSITRNAEDPLVIGSVKSNFGHTESAAGVAGLIKLALMHRHGRIPPNLHFETPNPAIAFDELRLHVPTSLEDWSPRAGSRIAGVNSFGFGGTNAHAIVGPAPVRKAAKKPKETAALLTLSARSPEALKAAASVQAEALRGEGAAALPDLASAMAHNREVHGYRLAVAARDAVSAADALAAYAGGGRRSTMVAGEAGIAEGTLAFVFSGMGQQWWGMGRGLLERDRVFADKVAEIDAAFAGLTTDWSLLDLLRAEEGASRIDETQFAQPAIFSIQVALAASWRARGVFPDFVVGHSVGEVAAAHVAGALDLKDAVAVSYHRSRLQARLAGRGSMLAVGLSADLIADYLEGLDDKVSLAAINSPGSVTLAGDEAALHDLSRLFQNEDIFARTLNVELPYHSAVMDEIRDDLVTALADIRPRKSSVPIVSTVSGMPLDGAAIDAEYWARNVREPVLFARAMESLASAGARYFLELGAHPVLATSMRECLEDLGVSGSLAASLKRREEDDLTFLTAAGQLHVDGYRLDRDAFFGSRPRDVELPTYQWQRSSYWVESEESRQIRLGGKGADNAHPLLGMREALPHPVWSARLTSSTPAYLADHCVQGAVIFPAAGYLEMALAAARSLMESDAVELQRVSIDSPLVFSDAAAAGVRLEVAGSDRFEIHSSATGGGSGRWVRHTVGRFAEARQETARTIDISALKARLADNLEGADCYRHLQGLGLEYGPQFQAVVSVWHDGREALGRISAPEALTAGYARHAIHPVVLDSAFQLLAFLPGEGTYLPVAVERLQFVRTPGPSCYGYVRVTGSSASRVVADVTIADDDGTVCCVISGLVCRRMESGATKAAPNYLYDRSWIPAPLDLPEPNDGQIEASILILATADERALALRQHLEGLGRRASIIDPSKLLNGGSAPKSALKAIETALGKDAVGPVVIDLRAPCDASADPAYQCARLRDLIVGLSEGSWTSEPVLHVVTGGAHHFAGDTQSVLEQAALWGFGRVSLTEMTELDIRLIDLSVNPADDELAAFAAFVAAPDDEDEIAFRGPSRFASRVEQHIHRVACVGSGSLIHTVRRRGAARLAFAEDAQLPDDLRPGPGQVCIEVHAAGINFKDFANIAGLLEDSLSIDPDVFGLEGAGVVRAVGEGVTRWKAGDRIFGAFDRSFDSHALGRDTHQIPLPEGLNFTDAAGMPVVFCSAHYALNKLARIAPGETVLIHSATGGLGLAAIQIARNAGARIAATAGSEEKRGYLRDMGIECVADSRSETFVDAVRTFTGGLGVEVVLNTLPAQMMEHNLALLRPAVGRLIDFANIHYESAFGFAALEKGISVHGFDLRTLSLIAADFVGTELLDEVAALYANGTIAPVPTRVWPIDKVDEAVRSLGKAVHIGKNVLNLEDGMVEVIPARSDIEVDPDGAYLVVAGLSGFGLATARWLASQGARHLVLAARRGADTPGWQEALADVAEAGVSLYPVALDVTDAADVDRLVARFGADLPPLKGIIHAAMVIADGPVKDMSDEAISSVIAPKIQGAWNLHRSTLNHNLDFFVLYSSASNMLGNLGQANYAAANEYLESLARYRRAIGLPALAIAWGAIGGVGYLSRETAVAENLRRQGVYELTLTQAFSSLAHGLREKLATIVASPLDWDRLLLVSRIARRSPRFDAMYPNGRSTGSGPQGAGAALGPELDGRVLSEIAGILGMDVDALDVDQPLPSLGFDSLMAVELMVAIEKTAGVKMERMALLRTDLTPADLIAEIRRHAGTEEMPAAPQEEEPEGDIQVENLSDSELDSLLEELSADGGGHG